ncbi:serine/threonine-protein kinase [Streptomyces sp. SID13031]|uniref:serine/threonine-protein kinase n=1 Tax=Streptomyces sp. SID13031 TaxID=2706046 RepID=UPI0013C9F89E|nr:serine/threonine-protein kinase [Streptomyces sp. SID13031]NEA37475.1 serine/threonine protein kinase [Streptomyces sp. SID13031]
MLVVKLHAAILPELRSSHTSMAGREKIVGGQCQTTPVSPSEDPAATYLTDRAKAVIQQGQNELQQVGPMPAAAVQLLQSYLSWRSKAEEVLVALGVSRTSVAQSQSRRHRDLVANNVPPDQLYREVNSERELLEEQLIRTLEAADGTDDPDSTVLIEFQGQSGTRFWYDPTSRLGSPGSYGTVYSGTDEQRRSLAVKRVEFSSDTPTKEAVERKQVNREIEVAQRLSGVGAQYLLPIIDWAYVNDALLIVMPKAERSLADLIARAPTGLPTNETRRIFIDITNGLVELHRSKVVHRDIKPHNILEYNGRWILADFGISRLSDVGTASHSFTGGGTLEYKAPEVFKTWTSTFLSDLYALGCVAYELATGRIAFPGPNYASMHASFTPTLPDNMDPGLSSLIYQLLAKEPGARGTDAREILLQLQGQEGLSAAQVELQEIHARAKLRSLERQAKTEQLTEITDLQRQATLALNGIWTQAAALAKRIVPDSQLESDGETQWSLSADDRKLWLQLEATPPASSNPLIIGIFVLKGDEIPEPGERSANILALPNEQGVPSWHIAQFAHNAIWGGIRMASTDWGSLETDILRQNPRGATLPHPFARRHEPLTPSHIVKVLCSKLNMDGVQID